MKITELGKSWNLALRNNTFLLFANLGLTVALVMSVYGNLSTHERVVLVPNSLDHRMEISWKSANADYLKAQGLYVATLIGNVTPKNVQLVADGVGAFLAPDIYSSVRAQILSLADDPIFQHANAINYFAPEQVIYEIDNAKHQKVFVVGSILSSSFNSVPGMPNLPDRKQVVYELSMDIVAGRPVITDFQSYSGGQAHTEKWKESQSQQQSRQTNAANKPENAANKPENVR